MVCIYHSGSSIHVDGHLGHFNHLTIVNAAALIISVQPSKFLLSFLLGKGIHFQGHSHECRKGQFISRCWVEGLSFLPHHTTLSIRLLMTGQPASPSTSDEKDQEGSHSAFIT